MAVRKIINRVKASKPGGFHKCPCMLRHQGDDHSAALPVVLDGEEKCVLEKTQHLQELAKLNREKKKKHIVAIVCQAKIQLFQFVKPFSSHITKIMGSDFILKQTVSWSFYCGSKHLLNTTMLAVIK